MSELGDSYLIVAYGSGITLLATSHTHAVYFLVIYALDKPYHWPRRERYMAEDAQKPTDLVMDKPVTDEILFGEVWRRRIREGVVFCWKNLSRIIGTITESFWSATLPTRFIQIWL